MGSSLRILQSPRTLQRLHRQYITSRRSITSMTSHEERTSTEPREPGLHTFVLDKMVQVSATMRLLVLRPLGEKPKARDLIH